MVDVDTNYSLTLDNIEQVKMALEALDNTMYSHIPQGITNDMINQKTH